MKQVVILAGGKGTRLTSELGDLPKPMAEVAGQPLLKRQIELCRKQGFTDIVLFTGYRSDIIESYFGDGSKHGVSIRVCEEKSPLGTAGCVVAGRELLAERFVVMYGDTLLQVDLNRMWAAHEKSGGMATLFVHPNHHPQDSDLVVTDREQRITELRPYPREEGFGPNMVSAALYVLERDALLALDGETPPHDFVRDLFPKLMARGNDLHAYQSPEYISDMGTPDRYAKVRREFDAGIPERRSLETPCPGVLFDRDGTLSVYNGYVRKPEDLELVEDAASSLHRLNTAGYRTALVTNQPVIARGDCTAEELEAIHHKFETLLGTQAAYLDKIYYCPHHPDKGFEGERPELKIECSCRKPAPGMLQKAIEELNIDTSCAWMVGDTTTDMQAAKNAGVRTVLVRTGLSGTDGKFPGRPDYVFPTLSEATQFILEDHAKLSNQLESIAAKVTAGQVIGLGGLAHAGKSTAATLIRELLTKRGVSAVVISLDGWLRDPTERTGNVRETYDYPAISEFFEQVWSRAGEALPVPHYNRRTRTTELGETVTVHPNTVVIIEGVVALDVPALVERTDLRLFVTVPEAIRERRFLADYGWRGRDKARIRELYEERQANETPLIVEARDHADAVIEGGHP